MGNSVAVQTDKTIFTAEILYAITIKIWMTLISKYATYCDAKGAETPNHIDVLR